MDFLNENCFLDPVAIRDRNFAARIFPEYPDEEEIARVADRIGVGEMELWTCEFGRLPRHVARQPIGLIRDALFENSPYNLLIRFSELDLFVWVPEDHEFFVVFGSPELVLLIEEAEIFSYSFADYVACDALSEKSRMHLEAQERAYSIR